MHALLPLALALVGARAHAVSHRPARLAALFQAPPQVGEVPQAFGRALQQAAGRQPAVLLLEEASLNRSLHGEARAQLARCGANLGCIGKLGHRARLDAVLIGRWQAADARSAVLQYLVIATATKSLVRRGSMTVESAATASAAVAAHFEELLGAAYVPEAAPPPAVANSSFDPPLADVAPPPAGGGEAAALPELTAPPAVVATADPVPAGPAAPAAPAGPAASPSGAAAPPVGDGAPPRLGLTQQLEGGAGGTSVAAVVGYAVAGVGVAALAGGAGYGAYVHQQAALLATSPGGVPQVKAPGVAQNADTAAGRANLLFGIGGGLAAAGATLVVLDRLGLWHHDAAAPQISAGPGAVGLGVTWPLAGAVAVP